MSSGMGPTLRYRAIVRALSPFLLAHLAWRASRDGGTRYLRERLGFGAGGAPDAGPRLWVHAASVGEVMTVLPLVRAALAGGGDPESGGRAPAGSVLVTTNTPTGAAVLARHAPPGTRHRYLPLDLPGAVRRFLARERPTEGWIVETEIWPWLYALCRARAVPLAIVNARLSPRTARHAEGPLATTYRRALTGVRVLARSADDAAGYRALGADAARTHVVGELKLAGGATATDASGTPDAPDVPDGRTSTASPAADVDAPPPAPIDRPFVVAASTHEDEETRLARAWLDARPDGLLVLAPRHPERGAELARRLPGCARRALGERPAHDARLHLADTLGELDAWYAHARGAFVGGSLIERGGHNVLEPARHGCPIVVGPHTANFVEPVAALRAREAIVEARDAAEVVAFLAAALDGTAEVRRRGRRARETVRVLGRDVVAAYLTALTDRAD